MIQQRVLSAGSNTSESPQDCIANVQPFEIEKAASSNNKFEIEKEVYASHL
jgi:hypothetical protein